nr:immunoglobulin heavy chain junction region [Macaca mulatta]MOW87883.1 immunoglobulin heavy chain junction region [Macaca mulatta]MOW88834.1 immunoglobulin heavy chain junction region [Macaca mulatta]MOW89697.1 immunoglobulin heavy chain junction region [Macaca mulatta]MOW90289.1 immunoglobulin heavy chain junction region [Macaca mulatta]
CAKAHSPPYYYATAYRHISMDVW